MESQEHPGTYYYVNIGSEEQCQCPDAQNRAPEHRCKHFLAAHIVEAIALVEQRSRTQVEEVKAAVGRAAQAGVTIIA